MRTASADVSTVAPARLGAQVMGSTQAGKVHVAAGFGRKEEMKTILPHGRGMARTRLFRIMNKGKPSGYEADTKKDVGAKSTSHERSGQAGAGPEWTERKQKQEREMVHAGGDGGPEQQAGGPDHHGLDGHEDKNP